MPPIFIGSTELTAVGDIKVGGVDVQEVYVGAVQIFPTGGGDPLPPLLVSWNPEIAEDLPVTAAFTRASTPNVETTTDGVTFWFQEAFANELQITDLRRVHNRLPTIFYDDIVQWNAGGIAGGGATKVPTPAEPPPAGSVGTITEQVDFTSGVGSTGAGFVRWNTGPTGQIHPKICSIYLKIPSGSAFFRLIPFVFEPADLITVTDTWQRFAIFKDPAGTPESDGIFLEYRGNTDGNTQADITCFIAFDGTHGPQFERCDIDNPIPSEIQNPSTVSATSNVAAVRYYNTANTTTIDGVTGVVTPGTGSTITNGYFAREPFETQRLQTNSIRDFTNGAWVPTDITPSQDAVGIDGTVQASTLTADANDGTIFQPLTRASSAQTFTCFVARVTGTGTIEMTVDGGTTWVDITTSLTTDIVTRFRVTQTLANPSCGFRLGASGDQIAVDFANLVSSGFVSSPISILGDRQADRLVDVTWPAESSAIIDVTVNQVIATETNLFGFGAAAASTVKIDGAASARLLNNDIDASVTASTSYEDERHSFGMSLKLDEGIIVDDEDNDNTDPTGTPGQGTIFVGSASDLTGQPCKIHRFQVRSGTMTVEQLKGFP